MTTLYDDGIRKVMKGITTLEEVFRVAKRTEQDDLVARHHRRARAIELMRVGVVRSRMRRFRESRPRAQSSRNELQSII